MYGCMHGYENKPKMSGVISFSQTGDHPLKPIGSKCTTCFDIITCMGACMTYRRVLDWMIGFIDLL
jgi:hypothetical protein